MMRLFDVLAVAIERSGTLERIEAGNLFLDFDAALKSAKELVAKAGTP